ncbi:hypothetical protein Y1Q_0022815 [Alligator mississippiensis]|uniref:Uncharacterized protein n=1 Tax=Alligator mississippiensis TaxID=8496 RepID=A0A151N4L7_ALLMI|nr:hypothetical protein Y1Q_0022815 [Alligator mississippiensis]
MCAGLAFSFSRVPNKLSLIAVVSHPPTEMMGLKLKSNSFQERSLKLRGELVTGGEDKKRTMSTAALAPLVRIAEDSLYCKNPPSSYCPCYSNS